MFEKLSMLSMRQVDGNNDLKIRGECGVILLIVV